MTEEKEYSWGLKKMIFHEKYIEIVQGLKKQNVPYNAISNVKILGFSKDLIILTKDGEKIRWKGGKNKKIQEEIFNRM
jgi:hypothetical protein